MNVSSKILMFTEADHGFIASSEVNKANQLEALSQRLLRALKRNSKMLSEKLICQISVIHTKKVGATKPEHSLSLTNL